MYFGGPGSWGWMERENVRENPCCQCDLMMIRKLFPIKLKAEKNDRLIKKMKNKNKTQMNKIKSFQWKVCHINTIMKYPMRFEVSIYQSTRLEFRTHSENQTHKQWSAFVSQKWINKKLFLLTCTIVLRQSFPNTFSFLLFFPFKLQVFPVDMAIWTICAEYK